MKDKVPSQSGGDQGHTITCSVRSWNKKRLLVEKLVNST